LLIQTSTQVEILQIFVDFLAARSYRRERTGSGSAPPCPTPGRGPAMRAPNTKKRRFRIEPPEGRMAPSGNGATVECIIPFVGPSFLLVITPSGREQIVQTPQGCPPGQAAMPG
jgi:hypothetical protein